MDRKNGGDPLAPPRPPKSIPRVHRPRAPEPPMMSAPLIGGAQHPTAAPLPPRQPAAAVPPPPLRPLPAPAAAPTTAPLAPLQSSITFSRRRPPATAAPSQGGGTTFPHLGGTTEPPSAVTLAAPRPENERLANEYVDTPFRNSGPPVAHIQSATRQHTAPAATESPLLAAQRHPNAVPAQSPGAKLSPVFLPAHSTQRPTLPAVITKQPVSFTKELPSAALHEDVDIHPSNGDSLNSITCPQCNRCRCEECQRPRQLPSRWVCDKTCLCSAETVIDYASCLCCVKALYYHCSKDHEMDNGEGDSISCADDPCSCLPHRRPTRWGCLAALSLVLPCLWCYWPMRGCVAACAKCYARHARHGCRCPRGKAHSSAISSLVSLVGTTGGGGRGEPTGGITAPSGVSGNSVSSVMGNVSRTFSASRNCDLTPEKRLLDSSPEY
ncbi:protein sprouty [Phlebotomus papatasi]|uniref:protein sprouty n=1 Tax=Phlebotomus papatasi TaxID=29031 RepID=UPI002483C930|nr:protein sprouty [Phlebotomus papatasi]XP_055701283.1 protein sprouty [Phlebotomus papatasi]XP_055701284.1 protein sprouty [Phlebotomus papatasi]